MIGDWELVDSSPPMLVQALGVDSKSRSGGWELVDRWRSGVPSLELLGSGRPCGLEAPEVDTGKRRARRSPGEGILRAAGAVEREQRAGPPGAGDPDAFSPPGLRSPPHAFPGQRHPDRIRAQSPLLPGGFGWSPPRWWRRQGLQAWHLGREAAH